MIRLVLVSALIAVSLGGSPRPFVPMLDGRIVGGVATTIEEYPHQLSFQVYHSHSCGACIISSTKALTAAHCTHGRSRSQLTIRAASSIRGRGGQVIYVANICQHPYYNQWTIDNDVSVITLDRPIDLGAGAQPIPLQRAGEDIPIGTRAIVTGWGTLYSGGSLSRQLQKVEVPRVSDADCKRAYGITRISASMICFGLQQGGKDSCQGDSGGPLVSGGFLVGVVSWGRGCAAANFPGVYAKVSALRSHIDRC